MKAGVVHRYSILPTGDGVVSACSLAMSEGVQISAHLDCCRGPFLHGGSLFPRKASRWFTAARKLAPQVRAEWSCQLEKLLSLGAMVTCIDSHRHLHHLPPLQDVFLEIAGEYRIGTVRTAVLPDRYSRFPEGLWLDGLGRRLQRRVAVRGPGTASRMLGFGAAGSVDREYIRKHLAAIDTGDVELVMHPATERVWSPGQPRELKLMLSEWFRELVK